MFVCLSVRSFWPWRSWARFTIFSAQVDGDHRRCQMTQKLAWAHLSCRLTSTPSKIDPNKNCTGRSTDPQLDYEISIPIRLPCGPASRRGWYSNGAWHHLILNMARLDRPMIGFIQLQAPAISRKSKVREPVQLINMSKACISWWENYSLEYGNLCACVYIMNNHWELFMNPEGMHA